MNIGIIIVIAEIIFCIYIIYKGIINHRKFKYELKKENSKFLFLREQYHNYDYGLAIDKFGKEYWVYMPHTDNKNYFNVEELIYINDKWEKRYVGFTNWDAIDKHICPNTGRSILP